MKTKDLYSLTKTDNERAGLDMYIAMALTISQQISLSNSYIQEKESL